jgi:hypothetical protein
MAIKREQRQAERIPSIIDYKEKLIDKMISGVSIDLILHRAIAC